MIPLLMITYNRLDYTKKALSALLQVSGAEVIVIDNNSTDGTQDWLQSLYTDAGFKLVLNRENGGVAGAMNQFLEMTGPVKIAGKVDNDTIVSPDFVLKMLPHTVKAEIIQAKHALIKETHAAGFDDWVKDMPADGPLRYHKFVGGSGILFKRGIVRSIPLTEWKLYGWRQWQREHPEFRKAFATDVEIQLLDTDENGLNASKYPQYYTETGRLKAGL